MKLDGITPSQGQGPVERNRKADSKPAGKSFADLLGKAKDAGAVPNPAGPAGSATTPEGPVPSAPPPMGDNLDAIRFRLQSGFYKDAKVDDILSDKLSGYFDEIA
jgi:hypothetical protein